MDRVMADMLSDMRPDEFKGLEGPEKLALAVAVTEANKGNSKATDALLAQFKKMTLGARTKHPQPVKVKAERGVPPSGATSLFRGRPFATARTLAALAAELPSPPKASYLPKSCQAPSTSTSGGSSVEGESEEEAEAGAPADGMDTEVSAAVTDFSVDMIGDPYLGHYIHLPWYKVLWQTHNNVVLKDGVEMHHEGLTCVTPTGIPTSQEDATMFLRRLKEHMPTDGNPATLWAWYRVSAQILLRWNELLYTPWVKEASTWEMRVSHGANLSQIQCDSSELLSGKDHEGIAMHVWNWFQIFRIDLGKNPLDIAKWPDFNPSVAAPGPIAVHWSQPSS